MTSQGLLMRLVIASRTSLCAAGQLEEQTSAIGNRLEIGFLKLNLEDLAVPRLCFARIGQQMSTGSVF